MACDDSLQCVWQYLWKSLSGTVSDTRSIPGKPFRGSFEMLSITQAFWHCEITFCWSVHSMLLLIAMPRTKVVQVETDLLQHAVVPDTT